MSDNPMKSFDDAVRECLEKVEALRTPMEAFEKGIEDGSIAHRVAPWRHVTAVLRDFERRLKELEAYRARVDAAVGCLSSFHSGLKTEVYGPSSDSSGGSSDD